MFYFLPILVLVQNYRYFRYFLLFILTYIYIIFGPNGSDHAAYQNFYEINCSGKLIRGIEPIYQYLSMLISSVIGCSNVDLFLVTLGFILLIILFILLTKVVERDVLYFSFCILVSYVVTFQLSYNFRTGIATLLFLITVLSFGNIVRIGSMVLAAGVHVQSLPLGAIVVFKNSRFSFKLIMALVIALSLSIITPYFSRFVIDQGLMYLSKYHGSVRVAGIPYLLIYIFVLRNIGRTNMKRFKFLILIGFLINIIFFFNSHISGRLSKPLEPLLLVLFFHCLYKVGVINRKLSKSLSFMLAMLPGIFYQSLVILN